MNKRFLLSFLCSALALFLVQASPSRAEEAGVTKAAAQKSEKPTEKADEPSTAPKTPTQKVSKKDAAERIDALVLDGLKKENIEPNAIANDSTFVRRVYLDLIGRIPTRAEATEFLESKAPGKKAALVDSLVGSDGYDSRTYNWFADLLRLRTTISGNGQSASAGYAYEYWLKDAIQKNRPYDKIVYDLVTSSGNSWQNPAIGYYLRDFGMPLDNLAMTIQTFLGTQIVCAQCHDHPFESVSQLDYYHLAAFTYGVTGINARPAQARALNSLKGKVIGKKGGNRGKKGGNAGGISDENFAALRRAGADILFPLRFNNIITSDRKLRLPSDYKYDDAKPLSIVPAATFFGMPATEDGSTPPVEIFGKWLISRDNDLFAKVIANRLWKRAFGMGLVEPIDDFKESVTASNPALLDYLGKLMLSLDFNLQEFERIIYRTRTYQREASVEELALGAPYYFPGPILRRMTAEQIWDSLVTMTMEDPDLPDLQRQINADKRIATVQLVAESVYDQSPQEFLESMKKVVEIKKDLTDRIVAAEKKIADARAADDDQAAREALREAQLIKRELNLKIEDLIYRTGLKTKLQASKGSAPLEKASQETSEAELMSGPNLMNELASQVFAGQRSFEEGMEEMAGSERQGLIKELVDSMFADRQADLDKARKEKRSKEQAEWQLKGKGIQGSYRFFDRFIRDRMKRASELSQPTPPGHFLREFGQSDRELIENSSHDASITQALTLLNGSVINAVSHPCSVLSRDLRGKNFPDRLDTVYMTVLSRHPTAEERGIFREMRDANPDVPLREISLVWALLNTRQFFFIQ